MTRTDINQSRGNPILDTVYRPTYVTRLAPFWKVPTYLVEREIVKSGGGDSDNEQHEHGYIYERAQPAARDRKTLYE
jgi:hypothetical protein